MFGEIYLYHLFCFPVVVCLNLSVNYDVCAGVRERRVKKLQIVSARKPVRNPSILLLD
jgi:hypothetical protein